jgi:hypothetical protein
MPWTERQVRFLESGGSPLNQSQKATMNRELHDDPSLGHNKKGSEAMKKPATHLREMRIEIHRGPEKKITGYTVHHSMEPSSESKSGAFFEHNSHTQPFSAKEHGAMMDHVEDHLSALAGAAAPKVAAPSTDDEDA